MIFKEIFTKSTIETIANVINGLDIQKTIKDIYLSGKPKSSCHGPFTIDIDVVDEKHLFEPLDTLYIDIYASTDIIIWSRTKANFINHFPIKEEQDKEKLLNTLLNLETKW